MKIKILAKNFEIDSKTEEYARSRMDSLDKLLVNSEVILCDLRLGRKTGIHKHGKVYFAEAKIKTNKKNYGALAKAESITEAIDDLKDELSKKIRRYKDKKVSLRNRGGRIIKELLRKIKK